MIYAKIEVILPRHHRMQAIDRASALGVYVAMICHSREFELDGFVPAAALRGFPSHSKKDVDELLRVGLIESAEVAEAKGYRIVKYAEKNETKEEIAARRAATNARVAKHRNGVTPPVSNGVSNGIGNEFVPGSGSVFDSDLPEEGSGETNSVQAYQRAYESGIREGLGNGSGYGMPENQRGALHQAILAHSEKRKGEKLLAWISAAAADFAEDIKRRPDEQKFYSSFGPRGFLKWLNDQAAKVEARAIP